eukprot:IDg5478t1
MSEAPVLAFHDNLLFTRCTRRIRRAHTPLSCTKARSGARVVLSDSSSCRIPAASARLCLRAAPCLYRTAGPARPDLAPLLLKKSQTHRIQGAWHSLLSPSGHSRRPLSPPLSPYQPRGSLASDWY